MDNVSKRVEELIAETKLNELLRKKEEEKGKNIIVWVLAVLGAVAAVAGIAYAVYCFLTPDYLEDFEDDFDDDFDDYFSEDDQI
ncbi:hypothetical protein KGMB01110_26690 [Mediterraneibacter butyricigenes]|jgi:hypothetical protein|uniref:DUF4366 domain-containing protein n=1 Tax=Mediterraneibacter butyricigenes TaxID=2316025 RepID=A0A391PEW9_9FIRM|nr:hypothetical protein [Mediterraneibacter butyricigenes]RGO28449.1 hypothetical protein DXB23_03845 [Dorea sp. OM02-2LB]RGV98704.1 hypothetical protein DWV97_02840 [Ruminococcus sp. AF14-10]GCA68233.1 hypothetical protein KGMB01110_26690 [Mediterraneibacter butyricigenes]